MVLHRHRRCRNLTKAMHAVCHADTRAAPNVPALPSTEIGLCRGILRGPSLRYPATGTLQ